MTKYLLLFIFGAVMFEPAASAQFPGASFASSIGSAAGRRISEQMNTSLRQGTRAYGGAGTKGTQGAAGGPAAGATPPAPPPPPPPPLQRLVSPTTKLTAPSWMTGESPAGPPLPAAPVNVDLALIAKGMERDTLLALGKPSSKMTLYEDGHLLEIYQYRNQTVASGTVRLRDGAVSAIEARP